MDNRKSLNRSKLRIIAGKFRGRKVFFSGQNRELRPTLDRVRETLFNWLSPYIMGADCLDLFAGSGIFGFEAISRGVHSVMAIESNYNTYQDILQNKIKLNLSEEEFKVINKDAIAFLKSGIISNHHKKFNIVFLDPPYHANQELLLVSLQLLVSNNFLQQGSKIYFESDKNEQMFKDQLALLNLQSNKVSQAGKVYFYLVEYNEFK